MTASYRWSTSPESVVSITGINTWLIFAQMESQNLVKRVDWGSHTQELMHAFWRALLNYLACAFDFYWSNPNVAMLWELISKP